MDLPSRSDSLIVPWPTPGWPGGFIRFDDADQWRAFIAGLDLDPLIPQVVLAKYARAQKPYLLSWIDTNLLKAGELVALTALEPAVAKRSVRS